MKAMENRNDNNNELNIIRMFRQRQKVINNDAITVDARSFRREMDIYITRASFGNPVVIRLANGQKLILSLL